MKKIVIMALILFVHVSLSAKDYCKNFTISSQVYKLKQSLPMKIDSATNLYNFVCLDSRYIYYLTLDLKRYSEAELQATYNFNQNQADSFFKSSKEKIRVRYVIHSLDGTIIKIINSK